MCIQSRAYRVNPGVPADAAIAWAVMPVFARVFARVFALVFARVFAVAFVVAPAPGFASALSSSIASPQVVSSIPVGRDTAHSDDLVTLRVVSGSDAGGDGSAARPFARITDAVRAAVKNKARGFDSRVVVGPGVYREGPIEFGYTNYASNEPDNTNKIEVVAAQTGTVTVSGADVFSDWTDAGGGIYWHPWMNDWGVSRNPWEGDVNVDDVVLRRELVLVDGAIVRQVLEQSRLVPGTFMVDENRNRLLLFPPSGTDLGRAAVEVGVRRVLWDQNHEDNVTIKGISFRHAVTEWEVARAAVRVSASDNLVIEDCDFSWTNWTGLYVGESRYVRLSNVTMNHNGGQGWAMFRVGDVSVSDSETSWNNWRGEWGGFTGWSIGNKVLSAHRLRIDRHRAQGNRSRGLWLDYDVEDAVIDGSVMSENLLDGLWIEASQGPITVRQTRFEQNGGAGLFSTFSANVTVDSNIFVGNDYSDLRIGGTATREVDNFETHESMQLRAEGWVVTNNQFSGTALRTDRMTASDWSFFVNTLVSDRNTFKQRERTLGLFQVVEKTLDLTGWRRLTGQDGRSVVEPS